MNRKPPQNITNPAISSAPAVIALTMSPLIVQAPTPRIILGLMTFGPDPVAGGRITSLDTFKAALDLLQSRGYNEVDTARMYINGGQEAFSAAAGVQSRGLTLATKIQYPVSQGDNSPDRVAASLATSLAALDAPAVDILYLHAADRGTPFLSTLRAVDALHRQAKFVRFGLSNFTSFEVAEIVMTCIHHGLVRPTVYQGMYNAITRSIETELIPACRRYGLDIVAYNPLAGGLFSGKVKTKDMVPAEGRFSDSLKMGKMYRTRYFKDSTFDALRIVEEATEKAGLTMIETALRWMVHHSKLQVGGVPGSGGDDGVIIGVSSVEQLKGNLDDAEKGPLPQEVVDALDRAWHAAKVDSVNYWHGEVKYGYDPREVLYGPNAEK